jgi:ABC-type uncharacterized transport system substrate-binding protein
MKPDVLVTGFGTVAAKAGKAAGDGIPVVFMAVGDPVGAGVVASLARPGGNVTGLSLAGFNLLREIVPAASLFAVILNPGTPYAALAYKELEAAAHVAKVELRAFEVRSPEEIAPQLEASSMLLRLLAIAADVHPRETVAVKHRGPKPLRYSVTGLCERLALAHCDCQSRK